MEVHKIIVIGDSRTGKSSLIEAFLNTETGDTVA
jgi:GTPase SAR1 family protein